MNLFVKVFFNRGPINMPLIRHVDPRDGYRIHWPLNFLEVPFSEHISIFPRGISVLFKKLSPYLTSPLHSNAWDSYVVTARLTEAKRKTLHL